MSFHPLTEPWYNRKVDTPKYDHLSQIIFSHVSCHHIKGSLANTLYALYARLESRQSCTNSTTAVHPGRNSRAEFPLDPHPKLSCGLEYLETIELGCTE